MYFPGDYYLEQHVELARQFALNVMPDKVLVERPSQPDYVDRYGQANRPYQDTNYITFDGSDVISCRFDNSRAFRPDRLRDQETVINEHYIHFPGGVDVRASDKIYLLSPSTAITNSDFSNGLTGWAATIVGGSTQVSRPPGVALEYDNLSDVLLSQSSTIDLEVDTYVEAEAYVEVISGSIRFNTPLGNIVEAAPYNGKMLLAGRWAAGGITSVNFEAPVIPTTAHVSNVALRVYDIKRVFEARKITDAGLMDITKEVQVTEMEFQHTRR